MLAYILRRIAQLVPVILVLTVAVFGFIELLPGSIVDTLIGTEGGDDAETREILAKEYGLDRPVYERYVRWLGRAVQFDFGNSLVTRRPISTELLSRIPATVYLAVVGIAFSMLIAVPLGTFAAVRRNTAVDYTAQVTSLAGISIPEFWFAILCVLFFSLYLGWLPSSGYVSPFVDFWGSLKFLILPAAAIGFRQAAFTTRLTRSSMLDELSKEYVDTARAMGLRERRVIFRYTLR
ncbi:MAG: ABC transporter permease, partial [Alphaproteobacteria bacterium]|nr:ABC transporter permease [Alphaproteobacteria bacterium]